MAEETTQTAQELPPTTSHDLKALPELLRPLLGILLATSSFYLALVSSLLSEDSVQLIIANQIDLRLRVITFGAALSLGAVTTYFFYYLSRRNSSGPELLLRWARILGPLVVSSFVPLLFQRQAWLGLDIAFLATLLGLGLALERLLGPALSELSMMTEGSPVRALWARGTESPWLRRLPLILVLAMIAFYIARVGHLTNVNHVKMGTMSSDLAEYDNLFYNALHGHPFRSPAIAGHLNDWNTLQGHAEFVLYMLLPFYAISPGAHALLWIQTSLVALTALPIYLLGAVRLGRLGGLVFAFVFLLMPATQQPNFYDFHFTPAGMFFVAWLMFFIAARIAKPEAKALRVGLFTSLALALLCREDISIGLTVLGVFLVLTGTLVKDALLLAGISGVYFVSMKFMIMPLFGRWWFDNMYNNIKADGANGFGAVVLTLVTNPAFVLKQLLIEPKLLYILHMTVPVLALWFRRPLLWLALLPGFVQTLLVTNRPPMFESSFQYTYLWIPYVVGASILALGRDNKSRGTLIALCLVGLSLATQFGVFPTGESIKGGFATRTFEISPAEQKRYDNLQAIIEKIPKEAVLSVTEAEGPHVSSRLIMYSLKYTLGPDPEYILLGGVGHRAEKAHVKLALESGNYGLVAREGKFLLLKRGANTKANEPAWRRAGLVSPAAQKKAAAAQRKAKERRREKAERRRKARASQTAAQAGAAPPKAPTSKKNQEPPAGL